MGGNLLVPLSRADSNPMWGLGQNLAVVPFLIPLIRLCGVSKHPVVINYNSLKMHIHGRMHCTIQ